MGIMHEALPVPMMEDRREPTTIDPLAGQRLINVRSWQNRLQKFGGVSQLGVTQTLAAVPTNFFECWFPYVAPEDHQVLALGPGLFQVWAGTAWASNLSGTGARPIIPTPAYSRFSVVNTLGKVYIASGQDENLIVYDAGIAPPNDLRYLFGHDATPTNLNCRVILGFGDRLVLVRTVEDGVDFPTRIRWNATDPGPIGGFDVALDGAGLTEVLESTSEPLTGGFVLGERCFLTKAREILELIPTGQPVPAFSIQSRVSGTGVISPFSVAIAENIAFFIGHDNVYAFDGTQLKQIGDPILDAIANVFAANEDDLLRPYGVINPHRGEYWLIAGTINQTAFVYDYRRDRWYENDLMTPGSLQVGPTAMGTISGNLFPTPDGDTWTPRTQTLVMNGPTSRSQTAFVLNENVNSRVEYGQNEGASIHCLVKTRQTFPKRRGSRGVVEPVATDRVNIMWEVDFKGAAETVVTVTITEADGETASQDVTTDAGGRGKAFFNFPWQCVDITLENTSTDDFRLVGVIGYRWTEGGIHLPSIIS